MLVNLQANVGASFPNPIYKNFNNFIYCNVGGKSTMSLVYKNIPPMEHNDIPNEVWVKDTGDSEYTKIPSYVKSCWLSEVCTDEIPIFRFHLIYDGYDFLYYPEFKLYERPYLLLEADVSGTDVLIFPKASGNEAKNLAYLQVGNKLKAIDYDAVYTIIDVDEGVDRYDVTLDRELDDSHVANDIFIFHELKYELQEDSNILNEGATTYSPFKFKFINPSDIVSKSYKIENALGKDTDFVLQNSDYTNILDLWGDDKYVSLSNNVVIEPHATIALNATVNDTDTQVEFTNNISGLLELNSYFSLKESSTEIFKVTGFVSTTVVNVDRAQYGTTADTFTTGGTSVYFPVNYYFIMLPYNKTLTSRYVLYRNLDFITSWV